ncbi:hypothetical protein OPV22_017249 [Ensete ventricosum]|uniref:Uncharacterized protein n=1 Tax=Ensete ventricosum TaxID=4639 RepID=A0AAV8QMX1_ENSVE|nr:hypothetical protein OPV22_017249 [Ensete ventricosum]
MLRLASRTFFVLDEVLSNGTRNSNETDRTPISQQIWPVTTHGKESFVTIGSHFLGRIVQLQGSHGRSRHHDGDLLRRKVLQQRHRRLLRGAAGESSFGCHGHAKVQRNAGNCRNHRKEGMTALWKGIVPGLHRQCLFGGLRIGLYEPVKSFYVGENFVGDIPLSKKILAGLTNGALAITTLFMSIECLLHDSQTGRAWGSLDWSWSYVACNAIINAAELVSYDQVKQTILKIPGFTDNVFTHLLSGLGAGFFAVCIGSPVDVVSQE